jgi:hypothetical protein
LGSRARRRTVEVVDATAVRWRKYGKDRLYVNGCDGVRIGWRDLITGEDHVEDGEAAELFSTTVATWHAHAGHSSASIAAHSGVEAPAPLPEPTVEADIVASVTCSESESEPAPETAEDLADRRPGAAARAEATRLKDERPVLTFVARVLGVHTDERAWRIGADGEEKVAARLAKLAKADPRWRFLHAIPVGERGSDIDHLVIGPGGVFTLNAKHHPGAKLWIAGNTFLVNGQRQPYIRNSRHEASRAARLLGAAAGVAVKATGVVVPVGAAEIVVKEPPRDLAVVNRARLVKWLTSQPEVLDPDVVDKLFGAARLSTTWHQVLSPRRANVG